jgi:galactokinase
VRAESLNQGGVCEFSTAAVLGRRCRGWGLYVQAVAAVLAQAGCPIQGCDALIHGTLPIASGLSSSASLEAAAAVLFAHLGRYETPPLSLARLCQRAEVEIVGMSCGILDQYSSILGEAGSALLLDCRSLTHQCVHLPGDVLPVICDTRAPRELTGSEYGDRRASCEEGARVLATLLPGVRTLRDVGPEELRRHEARLPPRVARRCRFVVEENARVLRMAAALASGDRGAIGSLCRASFEGARDLFEVCVPAMQAMWEAASAAPGSLGARQAGAGFGGCMIAFVAAPEAEAFARATASAYRRATGILPQVDPVRTAAGAGLLRVP